LVILVNFKPENKTVHLKGIPGRKTMKKLDETKHDRYAKEPDVVDADIVEMGEADNTIELKPFGLVCVDCFNFD